MAGGPRAFPERKARDVSHLGAVMRLFWSAVGANRDSAAARGMRLFKANLTPTQLEQYEQHGYFELIGGDTGRRYRIRRGTAMNIDEVDESGRLVQKWCFVPTGNLVAGDVYLAQKVALELFETEARIIANAFPADAPGVRYYLGR
jgi:hypothetical protein